MGKKKKGGTDKNIYAWLQPAETKDRQTKVLTLKKRTRK